MKPITRNSAILAASTLLAGTSAAQVCLGRPHFSTGPVQLGIATNVGNDISSVGAEMGFGVDRSFFGMGRVSQSRFGRDRLGRPNDPEGTTIGLQGGYQVSFGQRMATQFCPMVSAEWGRLDVVPGEHLRRSEIIVGGNIGWAPATNSGTHVVPFVGAGVAYLDRTRERALDPDVEFAARTYYPVTAGLGLHFDRAFMLVGNVTIPVNLAGADPVFGLRMIVPTGRGR